MAMNAGEDITWPATPRRMKLSESLVTPMEKSALATSTFRYEFQQLQCDCRWRTAKSDLWLRDGVQGLPQIVGLK